MRWYSFMRYTYIQASSNSVHSSRYRLVHTQIKSKIELDYTTTHICVASTVVARSVSYPSSISHIHHHQHHQYNRVTTNERARERERERERERATQQQAESDIDRCHSTTRAVGWVLHSLVKARGSRTPLPQTRNIKAVEASIVCDKTILWRALSSSRRLTR